MIGPDYCRLMARYNRWQNRSLRAAADGLSPAERAAGRGAFFGSIQATFSHILWADQMWMSRLAGGERPEGGIAESAALWPEAEAYAEAREAMDARILDWAAALTPEALAGQLHWFSGAAGREVVRPLALCVAHMFNHQTHHRGQIHAMLTAAGARPEATDLFLLPETD